MLDLLGGGFGKDMLTLALRRAGLKGFFSPAPCSGHASVVQVGA